MTDHVRVYLPATLPMLATLNESGALEPARWENFVKLRGELAATNETLEAQLRRKAQGRVANKALNKRIVEKYRFP